MSLVETKQSQDRGAIEKETHRREASHARTVAKVSLRLAHIFIPVVAASLRDLILVPVPIQRQDALIFANMLSACGNLERLTLQS